MTGTGWAIGIVLSYFAGSIPFGVLIAKTQNINIREHGSKNIGATNVGRVLGKPLGIICFLLDVAKGAVPVLAVGLIAGMFGKAINDFTVTEMLLWMAIAIASLLGHMYSPWLKFGGGKGVATTFGGMVAMWPLLTIPVVIALLTWCIVLWLWKMVSLASITASCMLPLMTVGWILYRKDVEVLRQHWSLVAATGLIAIMVFWKHRSNIQRILHGNEPRIGSMEQELS